MIHIGTCVSTTGSWRLHLVTFDPDDAVRPWRSFCGVHAGDIWSGRTLRGMTNACTQPCRRCLAVLRADQGECPLWLDGQAALADVRAGRV